MIIVAGHLRVAAQDRDAFLARSHEAIGLARSTMGCQDYVVAADPLDPGRINVYEHWTDQAALHAFRGDGPDDDLGALIISAHVGEFNAQPI